MTGLSLALVLRIAVAVSAMTVTPRDGKSTYRQLPSDVNGNSWGARDVTTSDKLRFYWCRAPLLDFVELPWMVLMVPGPESYLAGRIAFLLECVYSEKLSTVKVTDKQPRLPLLIVGDELCAFLDFVTATDSSAGQQKILVPRRHQSTREARRSARI